MSDQVHHPLFGRLYACLSPRTDAAGQREHRRELLAHLSGRIIELGAGSGLNFPHYPPGVSEVVAVEPEDYLRERARRAVAGARALAELHRVLRVGGELRFYEHVRPNHPRTLARWQRLDDWNIWPRLAGGCHPTRDTGAAIRDAGFIIERWRRFRFNTAPVTAPHIVGVARRP